MCEPTTIMLAASTGLGVAGTLFQGKAQADAARARASIAQQQAADALERGERAADKSDERTQGLIGAQRAGFAASGVATDSGTPLSVQGNTAALGEQDRLTILDNAEREATAFRNESSFAKSEAANAITGSILTSGSVVAGGVYDYYKDF